MATYEAFDSDAESGARSITVNGATATSSPSSRPHVLRINSRLALFDQEDDVDGQAFEAWRFDEDAYTLGVTTLFERRMPGALPSFCLALLAPSLQIFIALQVFLFLFTQEGPRGGGLGPRLVCSALSMLQLSNEAVEGLHKLIFSLRWLLGTYDHPSCNVSAMMGAILGVLQLMMGIGTCTLCILVIFSSKTILDTFFNYVALAFIADVDNYIMGSRVVRSFCDFDSRLRVPWASADKLQEARAMWLPTMVAGSNVVLIVMIPCTVVANEMWRLSLPEPMEINWLMMLPRCLALWLVLNGAMVLLGRRFPICYVALFLTVCSFLLQLAVFATVQATKRPGEKGCFGWSPVEKAVLWVFSSMMLPLSCAAELRPFGIVKLVPLQVKLVMIMTLIIVYELISNGCG